VRWRPPYLSGLFCITAVCGLVDAACFLALGGVFAEIMTGNMVLLAFHIGTGQDISETVGGGSPPRYLAAIGFFALGALLGGLILRGPSFLTDRRFGFVVELVLLWTATTAALVTDPGASGFARDVVVAMLATAMGLQNALLRARGAPDLATNVMTLTFTAFVADSALAGGGNDRWARRIGSILVFVASAAVGAWLVRYGARWSLLAATLVFTVALVPLLGSEPPPRAPVPGPTARRARGSASATP
jgi:uncharacterized membrane protein YoaK (UPF0700 family)